MSIKNPEWYNNIVSEYNQKCVFEFTYNGKLYGSGTQLIIKDSRYPDKTVTAYFIKIESSGYYRLRSEYYDDNGNKKSWSNPVMSKEQFYDRLVGVVENNHVDAHYGMRKVTPRDIDISRLFLAWIWYIFIMVISIIFVDAIGIWILASVIFFKYRKKVLEEESYYVQ